MSDLKNDNEWENSSISERVDALRYAMEAVTGRSSMKPTAADIQLALERQQAQRGEARVKELMIENHTILDNVAASAEAIAASPTRPPESVFKNFTKRELLLIRNCIGYAADNPAGLPGHNLMIIISKLVDERDLIQEFTKRDIF